MKLIESSHKKGHKDIFRSYYTNDDALVSYMVDLLALKDGDDCLEPSAGSGCFIDSLLATGKDIKIYAIEISAEAADGLSCKYKDAANIDITYGDFLQPDRHLISPVKSFDRIIANPPYGGWQEYAKRDCLKSRFPDLYVKETYGVFIAHSLTKLNTDGRAVFIIPETFLYLHLQKGLRKRLLEQYSIVSIDVFPSTVFPGVNFGYARLCIISIDNCLPNEGHSFTVRHSGNIDELISQKGKKHEIDARSVLRRAEYTFPLSGYSAETMFIDDCQIHLGDIADCVTGIYSGADTQFLRRSPENLSRVTKYPEIEKSQVFRSTLGQQPSLSGLNDRDCFLPVLKGGGFPYLKPELWFLNWSIEAVTHYKNDKKARFQNSRFYFRAGIGFPMVSSGRASASVIKQTWIFDQSVVGIFPKFLEHFGFLLAFLNSSICWRLLRQINPSTNNSARYLKRLPIVLPTEERLAWFDLVVNAYVKDLESGRERNSEIEQLLDDEIGNLYASAKEICC
jgi:adenine-specific DNA-methyltransferase